MEATQKKNKLTDSQLRALQILLDAGTPKGIYLCGCKGVSVGTIGFLRRNALCGRLGGFDILTEKGKQALSDGFYYI